MTCRRLPTCVWAAFDRTLKTAWDTVMARMNAEGEVHRWGDRQFLSEIELSCCWMVYMCRKLGQDMLNDLSKPLKQFADGQTKARKPVSVEVDIYISNVTVVGTYLKVVVMYSCVVLSD